MTCTRPALHPSTQKAVWTQSKKYDQHTRKFPKPSQISSQKTEKPNKNRPKPKKYPTKQPTNKTGAKPTHSPPNEKKETPSEDKERNPLDNHEGPCPIVRHLEAHSPGRTTGQTGKKLLGKSWFSLGKSWFSWFFPCSFFWDHLGQNPKGLFRGGGYLSVVVFF